MHARAGLISLANFIDFKPLFASIFHIQKAEAVTVAVIIFTVFLSWYLE
jgi:hypothetical protein